MLHRATPEQGHGRQPGDPTKLAAAICAVVDSPEPPLRIALGEDALARVRGKLRSVSAELDRWEDVSRTTAFEASGAG